MPRPSKCIVETCTNPSHAKGYCRKHYGQIWRRGMIYDTLQNNADEKAFAQGDDAERLRTLERELQNARQVYQVVVGFEGRIKWRRKIETLQLEIRKLAEKTEELANVPAGRERVLESVS